MPQVSTDIMELRVDGVLRNDGPGTLYYRDRSPVSASTNDGSLTPGQSVELSGVQTIRAASGFTSVSLLPPATTSTVSPLTGTRGLLLGTSPTTGAVLADFAAFNTLIAPRRLDMALYFATLPTDPLIFSGQRREAKSLAVIPQIAWSPSAFTLGSMADGTHDAQLDAAAANAKFFDAPIIVRLCHEFNLPGGSYGHTQETPAQFITGWKYVVNRFRSAGATNVRWCWDPNVWINADAAGVGVIDPGAYWPGSDYVDLTALDGYQTVQAVGNYSFADLFLAEYRILVSRYGKPVHVGEVGVSGIDPGINKADWFRAMWRTVANDMPRLAGLSYWNRDDFAINNPDEATRQAFANGVSSGPMAPPKPAFYSKDGDFGSGVDGDCRFDGTNVFDGSAATRNLATTTGSAPNRVYTLTRDVHATDLVVDAGITVNTAGFRIYCRGTAEINGTLRNVGNNANANTGGTSSSVASIGVTTAGSNGTSGAGFGGTQTTGQVGGSGGAAGLGSNGAGGGARSPANSVNHGISSLSDFLPVSRADALSGTFRGAGGTVSIGGGVPGATGGGDATNAGGGGGAGGGIVFLAARIVNFGAAGGGDVRGGNGGIPATGNCGGGGGGGGGTFLVLGEQINGIPANTLTGGSGGAKTGTGVAGSNGTSGIYKPILV